MSDANLNGLSALSADDSEVPTPQRVEIEMVAAHEANDEGASLLSAGGGNGPLTPDADDCRLRTSPRELDSACKHVSWGP